MTVLQLLTAIFLMGIAVPIELARKCATEHRIKLLLGLGLVCRCEYDNNLLIGIVGSYRWTWIHLSCTLHQAGIHTY